MSTPLRCRIAFDEQARAPVNGLGLGVQADRLHPESQGDPDQTLRGLGPAHGRQADQMPGSALLSQSLPSQGTAVLPQGEAKPSCCHIRLPSG